MYKYGFQQFFSFSGFNRYVSFVKIHLLVTFFNISGFMGMIFRKYGYTSEKYLRISGYPFEKILRAYGWYFNDLNGTTPCLRNSSDPPSPGSGVARGYDGAIAFPLFKISKICN